MLKRIFENIELHRHWFNPKFILSELRKQFFYEHKEQDIESEYNPYYGYSYQICPYIYITICQEDRKPDLTQKEAQKSLGYKFKTKIRVRLLWLEYSFILRSIKLGWVIKENHFLFNKSKSEDLGYDLYIKYEE